jgi:hypothetical protein
MIANVRREVRGCGRSSSFEDSRVVPCWLSSWLDDIMVLSASEYRTIYTEVLAKPFDFIREIDMIGICHYWLTSQNVLVLSCRPLLYLSSCDSRSRTDLPRVLVHFKANVDDVH